jgi:hypothetical protein
MNDFLERPKLSPPPSARLVYGVFSVEKYMASKVRTINE